MAVHSTAGNVISIEGLSFAYNKKEPVLLDVNMTVEDGEFVALLGHNGAGKTTLLKLIIGVLSQNAGTISINGDIFRRRRDVFLLSEKGGLYTDMTIAENIYYRALLFDSKPIHNDDLTHNELIKQFKLSKHLSKKITELSSGLKKRASLVVGLLFSPKLLLLDEPTNSIDPATRTMLKDYLSTAKINGCSAIIVTHDLDFCFNICDKTVLLNNSQIVLEKAISSYKDYAEFEAEYLEFTDELEEEE
jgi:ABC-type multidrug transport system ATPase subunit